MNGTVQDYRMRNAYLDFLIGAASLRMFGGQPVLDYANGMGFKLLGWDTTYFQFLIKYGTFK